jgi:hypothetical protein
MKIQNKQKNNKADYVPHQPAFLASGGDGDIYKNPITDAYDALVQERLPGFEGTHNAGLQEGFPNGVKNAGLKKTTGGRKK